MNLYYYKFDKDAGTDENFSVWHLSEDSYKGKDSQQSLTHRLPASATPWGYTLRVWQRLGRRS